MIPAFDLAPKSIPDRDSAPKSIPDRDRDLKLINFVSINDPSSSLTS